MQLFLEVEVGDYHEVNGVEVGRLPLDVSWIGDPSQVGLFLVIEDDAVVLVRQTFHVFF